MPDEIVEKAARLVASSGHPRPRLTLTGGEPLLEPRLVRLAASTLRTSSGPGRAPALRLFTNGSLLDAERTKLLAAEDAEVTVSFDGVRDAQDARAPGTAPLLSTVLGRLASTEPDWYSRRIGVRVTLHSGNVAVLEASVDLFLALGLRRIEVLPLVTPDPGWGPTSESVLDRELESLAGAPGLATEPERTPFLPFRPVLRRGAGDGPTCGLGSPHVLFLDVDGTPSPCGAMVPSFLREPPWLVRASVDVLAGTHCLDRDSRSLLVDRSTRASTLGFARGRCRKRSMRGPCASCEALPECFVCPASIAFAPEQDPDLVPAIQCDWNRLVARHRRAFLARLASRGSDPQRAGNSSSAAETSAVTPARIDGA